MDKGNKNKYIIGVCGDETTGKTCTIRNVWDMLQASHESRKITLNPRLKHEVWGYIEYDALRNKIHDGISPLVKAGGVNLSRLSAKSIIELIESLD